MLPTIESDSGPTREQIVKRTGWGFLVPTREVNLSTQPSEPAKEPETPAPATETPTEAC